MSKINDEKLKVLCMNGYSNKDIAKELDCSLSDVYARRSALGITIEKCKAGALNQGKRSADEIKAEIKKVERAKADTYKHFCRAEDRLEELHKELEEAGK